MKKRAICLMIACLSLFAYPYKLSAGNEFSRAGHSGIVIPPVHALMQKKANAFKKSHPDIFKKDNVSKEDKMAEARKAMGGVLIISTGALLIIILLLILLL